MTFSSKNEIFFKTWVVNLAISVPLSARVSGGNDADLVASEYEQEVLPSILKEQEGVGRSSLHHRPGPASPTHPRASSGAKLRSVSCTPEHPGVLVVLATPPPLPQDVGAVQSKSFSKPGLVQPQPAGEYVASFIRTKLSL